jgi:hypothetical protein
MQVDYPTRQAGQILCAVGGLHYEAETCTVWQGVYPMGQVGSKYAAESM